MFIYFRNKKQAGWERLWPCPESVEGPFFSAKFCYHIFMAIENFDYKKYRDELAAEIKKEPDKEKRRELLQTAQETEEYEGARILRRAGGEKEKRRLAEGGFLEESEAFGKLE